MSGISYDYVFDVPYDMQEVPYSICEECDIQRELFEYNKRMLCIDCLCKEIQTKGE